MKKIFKRDKFGEKNILFDETINSGIDSTIYTGRKKISKSEREKCLADLGSGSETEYCSAETLYNNQDTTPKFLNYLIECCEKEGTCLNPYLCLAFIAFIDKKDERILPAIIQSFSKCPDAHLGNHTHLLRVWGGKEAKDALKERFDNLKNNPQVFAKLKDWNDLAFSVLDICLALFSLEPDNIEVIEYLAKLLKHPNSFNQEISVSRIVELSKNEFIFFRARAILDKTLQSLSKTRNIRLFGMLLPYMFQVNPENTYEKFKRLYLNAKKEDRYNFAVHLMYSSINNSMFWICKLIRELPKEDTDCFQDYLNWSQIKPMNKEEVVFSIKQDFASESPNTRISALNKLKFIGNEVAKKILKEALIDEPDNFIRKEFEKHLKKLKKEKV